MTIHTLLIANRGEIACRVIRTARRLGIRTVAVHSAADAGAPHVHMAHTAIEIGPAAVAESYLSIERIMDAARKTGADAIHPGYGFLSENAKFARACEDAGITFVGPPIAAIDLMGDKARSKLRMIEAGVPTVPGYQDEDQSDAKLLAEASRIGFPLMVKASAGGGGRGMRLVDDPAKLERALKAARSEAKNAFGDDRLILEKAVVEPRHVEIQVFADRSGNVVHLGERDCSVQRRHQKVVEEAPSPAVTPEIRSAMGEAAVQAAQSIGYLGAGTVEFLLDRNGDFYFLEMNTRLQVEHPVTEMVTGYDLVEWQIRVAEGENLPARQADIRLDGHAIEVRLYAESPAKNFLPRTGRAHLWRIPEGAGIRVDAGLSEGQEITPFYDPMIAKVIAHGPTRDAARLRLANALRDTKLLGVETNRRFLIETLEDEVFAAGEATTAFIEQRFPKSRLKPATIGAEDIALAAVLLFRRTRTDAPAAFHGWRSSGQTPRSPMVIRIGEDEHEVTVIWHGGDDYDVATGGGTVTVAGTCVGNAEIAWRTEAGTKRAAFCFDGESLLLQTEMADIAAEETTYLDRAAEAAGGDGAVVAPMNGRVLRLAVKAGDKVTRGQIVAVLEAMKMEHEITAPVAGEVSETAAAEGQQVATNALLVRIEAGN
ncbi:acetyl/propionyl/methylcrotonyl-CoA carboxylase subunit alpha [Minwuia thermotolerans]|uniref:3-methylcrotonyl-CoA carboxylase n=1 Tax=Minwuia thermotolerans TaxID=2056226 RepID=A0A2M9G5X9_9PROT|nr:acetyl/propionyl/methylcrotonyl-CoA carboxylase subunit alpha [Minwuia thermotolerans]PJK31125.1 3-methylcrotonyl-CoA carboxylase [Minwuia thermotolerans]